MISYIAVDKKQEGYFGCLGSKRDVGQSNGNGKVSEVASERMNRTEVRGDYERRVCRRLNTVRIIVREGAHGK